MNTKRNNSILNLGHSGHFHQASVVERHPQHGHLSLPFLRFRCQSTHRMRMLPVGLKTIARPFSCPPGFTWSQASMPWFITPSRHSNCSSHLHIWPPHMDQISPQHLAMLLVEGHPSSDNLPDTKITTGNLVSTLWLLSQRGGGLYSRQQHQRRDTEPGPKSTPAGGRSLARTPHQDRRRSNQ